MRYNSLLILLLLSLSAMSQRRVGNYTQKKIIFEGNSLMNYNAASTIVYGQYVPLGVYSNVLSAHPPYAYTSYAIGSRTQTMINASLPTNITPYIKKNDVIVLWEGTNDLNVNALSGASAFANVVTYLNTVAAYSPKVVICTVIARDYATDAADLMTRVGDYNTLVRNNATIYGYTVCDLAADALFDARTDASNATYYNADKIHLIQAGYDRVITLITATLNTIL